MKTLKSKVLALAIVALGMTVGITACKKDSDKDYSTENLNGIFVGTHKLDIPAFILDNLSGNLPPDTLEDGTLVPVDLSEGFEDVLTVTIADDKLLLYSTLLDIEVEGKIVGNNRFTIPLHEYDELSLGTAVSAKNAKIRTSKDIIISSNEPGTEVVVNLSLAAREIAGVKIGSGLTILTDGKFIKQ